MSTITAYHHQEQRNELISRPPIVQQRMVTVQDLSYQEPMQGLLIIQSDSEDDDDDIDDVPVSKPLPDIPCEYLMPTHLETIIEGSMIEDELSIAPSIQDDHVSIASESIQAIDDRASEPVDSWVSEPIDSQVNEKHIDDRVTDDDRVNIEPAKPSPGDQERMIVRAHEEKTSTDPEDTWRGSASLQKPFEPIHQQPHTHEEAKPATIWSDEPGVVRKRASKEEVPQLTVQTSIAALSSSASLCSRCSSISADLVPNSATTSTSTSDIAPRLARPASVMSFIPPRPTSMYTNHHQQPIIPHNNVHKSQSTPDLLAPVPCTKSKLSIASFSLTYDEDSLKTYHRMASKTNDPKIKMAYVHYLLDVAKLYKGQKKNATRERLLSEAGFWIDRLARQGHPEALYIKGKWHWRPEEEECAQSYRAKPEPHKAYKCFQQAARADCVDALYEMARYQKAYGEYSRAVKCYEKAASKGHTLATYKMAKILLRGQLQQKRNINRGLDYLKKAADASDSESAEPAYVLSCVYADELERIGIDRDSQMSRKDERLALQYLQKATQTGLPMALHHMGQVHEFGLLGQSQDPWQGYACYSRAAEDGDERAMLDLSRLYVQGIPGYLMPQHETAFKWCQRAASKGLEKAEYILGTYYEDGVGTMPDYPRALECFGKAASKGYAPAAEKLNLPKCVQPMDQQEQQQLSRLSSLRRKATFELVHQVEHPQLKDGPVQGNCSIM